MNVKTTQFGASITTATYDKLLTYCNRTNRTMGNAVDELLSMAIDAKYEQFPNLVEREDKCEEDVLEEAATRQGGN